MIINKMSSKKGITIVSLVVTIVVLIILVGVTISLLVGENGIIKIAKQSKQKTIEEQIKEASILNSYVSIVDSTQQKYDENTILALDSDIPTFDGGIYKKVIKGTPVINKDEYKCGNSSFYLDGKTNFSVDSKGLILENKDFTIDLWMKTDTNIKNAMFLGQYSSITNARAWSYKISHNNTSNSEFTVYNNGWTDINSTKNICDNQWHHLAVVRKNTTIYIFTDGKLEKTQVIPENFSIGTNENEDIVIGYNAGDNSYYKGYMSNIRISKVARWISDFSIEESELYKKI